MGAEQENTPMTTNTTNPARPLDLRAAAKSFSLGLLAVALVLAGSVAHAGGSWNGQLWNGNVWNGNVWNGPETAASVLTIDGVSLSGGQLVQR
jgi:hypothetical protein